MQGCEGSACFLCFYVYCVRHCCNSVDIVLVPKGLVCEYFDRGYSLDFGPVLAISDVQIEGLLDI